jgi:DNA-binding NarL/FixJ family response regulator
MASDRRLNSRDWTHGIRVSTQSPAVSARSNSATVLRVLLADDHQVVRQGFRAVLEQHGFDVVAEAANGGGAVELAEALRPDVALLDLSMPQMNGLNAATEILRRVPTVRVGLLTMHTEEHQVIAALRAGIRAYILKTQAAAELIQAIHEIVQGGIYLSPGVSRVVVDAYLSGRRAPGDQLAPREREVLQLVAEGRTSKEIATLLAISVKTAESYRGRIMEKLDIHDTAGLVRYAIRHQLIQP